MLASCEAIRRWVSDRPVPESAQPTFAHRPLRKQELAIIVNTADPLSIAIGDYYQRRRGIPAQNRIEISFPRHVSTLSPELFQRLQRAVDRQTSPQIQAYALTWAQPYRVGCMSITTAFSVGFDEKYCANGCEATAPNPYFNAQGGKPQDYGLRLTMAIAAEQFYQATALINRGVLADNSRPQGTGYLLQTDDLARNARVPLYAATMTQLSPLYSLEWVRAEALQGRRDVMFYFTGRQQVERLRSNRFLPGAMADHLTSFGGQLTDSSQMSSLRWLEAGATGSYGTVVEPCNFPQKFPHPGIAMAHYLQGDTLIEAYWKSVAWLGQGIFIGEPLAQPFR